MNTIMGVILAEYLPSYGPWVCIVTIASRGMTHVLGREHSVNYHRIGLVAFKLPQIE